MQKPIIKKVEVGENFFIQCQVFNFCNNLETITYPSKTGVYAAWSSTTFQNCVSLRWLNLTKNTKAVSYNALNNCISIASMTVPKIFNDIQTNVKNAGFTSLTLPDTFNGTFTFEGSRIEKFRIPSGVTNTSNSFQGNKFIKEIEEPSSITTRSSQTYASCISLQKLSLSAGCSVLTNSLAAYSGILREVLLNGEIATIGAYAFINCACLGVLNFTKNTVVPTLENINAFSYCNCRFIVPDNLYDEWIVATNWNTYADRIIKASEYQPNNE